MALAGCVEALAVPHTPAQATSLSVVCCQHQQWMVWSCLATSLQEQSDVLGFCNAVHASFSAAVARCTMKPPPEFSNSFWSSFKIHDYFSTSYTATSKKRNLCTIWGNVSCMDIPSAIFQHWDAVHLPCPGRCQDISTSWLTLGQDIFRCVYIYIFIQLQDIVQKKSIKKHIIF